MKKKLGLKLGWDSFFSNGKKVINSAVAYALVEDLKNFFPPAKAGDFKYHIEDGFVYDNTQEPQMVFKYYLINGEQELKEKQEKLFEKFGTIVGANSKCFKVLVFCSSTAESKTDEEFNEEMKRAIYACEWVLKTKTET